VAENVSVPVDAIAWALRKTGIPVNKPMLGSDWMREKGLTKDVEQGGAQLAGETVGMLSPLGFTKQGAQALIEGAGKMKNMPVGNMFIGQTANTWDEVAAAQAKMMEGQGKSAQEIWKETGTFKGPDGKYRQEIADNQAYYDPTALEDLKFANEGQYDFMKHTMPLGGVVEHPPLYKAYPDLSDVTTGFMPQEKLGKAFGAYSPKHDRITLKDAPDKGKHTSSALHEIQHAIQTREGWNEGGNLANGMDVYTKLAGEAEARATQARMKMTPKQRREAFPLDSYDVPIDQLIVK
jgi:hypothetical protein